MNIFSLTKTRAFRHDGRISVILSLKLPQVDETQSGECFNSFYLSAIERYAALCEKIKHLAGKGPIKVGVDFSILEKGRVKLRRSWKRLADRLIFIKRSVSIRYPERTVSRDFCDIYDLERGIFLR